MHSQNQKGFTLVEVILFFALSSAFIVIAFVGIRGRSENAQFTDSVRSLESYLISEQNKVSNGVNSSLGVPVACNPSATPGAEPGKNDECILLGRIITFGETPSDLTMVKSSVMYGANIETEVYETLGLSSDIEKIAKSSPTQDDTQNTYVISWDTEFQVSKSKNGGAGNDINKFGWLRSPVSNVVIPIVFDAVSDVDDVNYYVSGGVGSYVENDVDAKFCFKGIGGKVASINFDVNGTVTSEFDDEDCR